MFIVESVSENLFKSAKLGARTWLSRALIASSFISVVARRIKCTKQQPSC